MAPQTLGMIRCQDCRHLSRDGACTKTNEVLSAEEGAKVKRYYPMRLVLDKWRRCLVGKSKELKLLGEK